MERHFIRLVLYNLSLLIFFFVIIVKLFLIARVDYDQSLSYMQRDNINFIFVNFFLFQQTFRCSILRYLSHLIPLASSL